MSLAAEICKATASTSMAVTISFSPAENGRITVEAACFNASAAADTPAEDLNEFRVKNIADNAVCEMIAKVLRTDDAWKAKAEELDVQQLSG